MNQVPIAFIIAFTLSGSSSEVHLQACLNTCEFMTPPAGHHVHLQTVQAPQVHVGPFG